MIPATLPFAGVGLGNEDTFRCQVPATGVPVNDAITPGQVRVRSAHARAVRVTGGIEGACAGWLGSNAEYPETNGQGIVRGCRIKQAKGGIGNVDVRSVSGRAKVHGAITHSPGAPARVRGVRCAKNRAVMIVSAYINSLRGIACIIKAPVAERLQCAHPGLIKADAGSPRKPAGLGRVSKRLGSAGPLQRERPIRWNEN